MCACLRLPPPLAAAAAAKGEKAELVRLATKRRREKEGYCALNVGGPCAQPQMNLLSRKRALHLLDLLAIFSKEIESNAQMDFERAVAAAYSWLATKT